MLDFLGILACGLGAGALGGFLGIGGGIVLIPFLRFSVGLSPAQAAGTCVLAVFCTTLSGSFRHYRAGHVPIRQILPVIAAGGASTALFSRIFLFTAQREHWLDLGTGLVFTLISSRMIVEGMLDLKGRRSDRPARTGIEGGLLPKLAIGSAGGVLPGLLGIGTGGILVPAFTWILKSPIKTAIGSSLTCFSVNALISSAFKLNQGFVILEAAGPACLGTLAGAYAGAALNRRFPSAGLKLLFGALFTYVSFKFILSFWGVAL